MGKIEFTAGGKGIEKNGKKCKNKLKKQTGTKLEQGTKGVFENAGKGKI